MIPLSEIVAETKSRFRIPPLLIFWTLVSISVSAFLLRDLLFSPGLPYTRDLVFPYDLESLSHLLGTWNTIHSQFNPEINKIPLYWTLFAASSVLGSELTIKLLFGLVVFLLAFVPFLSIYLIFKPKVKSSLNVAIICSIPSLLYLLNPWTVDRISNHLYMVFGMALNPLILVLYLKLINTNQRSIVQTVARSLPVTVVLSLASISTHNLLYVIPLLFTVFAYMLITGDRTKRRGILISSLIFVSLYAGLNAYWIVPNAVRFSTIEVQPSYDFSIEEIERLSERNSPSNVIMMSGGGAWKEVKIDLPNPAHIALFAIVPLFAISSLLLVQRNRFLIFLGLLFAVVYILTLGTNAPLPIYDWLLASPAAGIIWLFRDPYRLVQFTVMIFSFMLSYTLYAITSKRFNLREIPIILIAVALIASPAAYTFANSAGNRLVTSQLPTEYEQVREFLQSDEGSYRVLWLPLRQYQYYDWNMVKNEVSGDVYSMSSPVPTYGLTTTSNNLEFWNYFYSSVLLDYRTNYIGKMLSHYDIKYVIVHSDLVDWQKAEAEKAIAVLGYQEDMLLKETFGQFHIFLNLDYQDDDLMFSASSLDSDSLDKLPELASENFSLPFYDITKWTRLPNSDLTRDDPSGTVTWNVKFVESQERYEVRLPLDGLNLQDYDKLVVSVLPVGKTDPALFAAVLYTNESDFQFTRYDLEPVSWNTMTFDLRGAKLGQASASKALNLQNVTGIGLVIYKKYYPTEDYTFRISEINFIPDNTGYSSTAFMRNYAPDDSVSAQIALVDSQSSRSKLRIETSEPLILSYSESYDPFWKAQIVDSDSTIDSIPENYVSTGFVLPRSGSYEIDIYYSLEDWLRYGGMISVATTGFIGLFLLQNRRQLQASSSTKKDDVRLVRSGKSQSDLIWSSREILATAVNPRGRLILVASNYFLIASLALLVALPSSYIVQFETTILNNILNLSYFLLIAGIILKCADFLLCLRGKNDTEWEMKANNHSSE